MTAAYLGASKAENWPAKVEFHVEQQNVDPACSGKTAFANRGRALAHLRKRKRGHRVQTKQQRDLHPYRCGNCHKWHLGSGFR